MTGAVGGPKSVIPQPAPLEASPVAAPPVAEDAQDADASSEDTTVQAGPAPDLPEEPERTGNVHSIAATMLAGEVGGQPLDVPSDPVTAALVHGAPESLEERNLIAPGMELVDGQVVWTEPQTQSDAELRRADAVDRYPEGDWNEQFPRLELAARNREYAAAHVRLMEMHPFLARVAIDRLEEQEPAALQGYFDHLASPDRDALLGRLRDAGEIADRPTETGQYRLYDERPPRGRDDFPAPLQDAIYAHNAETIRATRDRWEVAVEGWDERVSSASSGAELRDIGPPPAYPGDVANPHGRGPSQWVEDTGGSRWGAQLDAQTAARDRAQVLAGGTPPGDISFRLRFESRTRRGAQAETYRGVEVGFGSETGAGATSFVGARRRTGSDDRNVEVGVEHSSDGSTTRSTDGSVGVGQTGPLGIGVQAGVSETVDRHGNRSEAIAASVSLGTEDLSVGGGTQVATDLSSVRHSVSLAAGDHRVTASVGFELANADLVERALFGDASPALYYPPELLDGQGWESLSEDRQRDLATRGDWTAGEWTERLASGYGRP